MIYSKHRFTLDMQVAHSQIAIPVTVGDTAKIFYISLTDGGEPYKITDGSLAMLTIHRPTDTTLQAFCPIKNNSTIVYDFSQNENTAVVEGIHNCELTLYGPTTGGVISTSWFTMVVNPRVVNKDDLNLTDEDQTVIDTIIATELSRQSAEEARVAAEKERKTYYEDFVKRVNNGEFGGADSDNGVSITTQTLTLQVGQWAERSSDGMMYEMPFEGMTADATVLCNVVPNYDMEQEATRCMVRCVMQEDGYLWFKSLSGETPTIDIDMNILVVSV